MKVDVAIIGAGPAGAACALALKRSQPQLQVALLGTPSAAYPGETLAPAASALLRQLGLHDALQTLQQQASLAAGERQTTAWGKAQFLPGHLLQQTHNRGEHLPRQGLEGLLLLACAQTGVELLADDIASVQQQDAGWHLNNMAAQEIEAGFVVDASGRQALLGQHLQIDSVQHDRLQAALYLLPCEAAGSHSNLLEACENGWWYSSCL